MAHSADYYPRNEHVIALVKAMNTIEWKSKEVAMFLAHVFHNSNGLEEVEDTVHQLSVPKGIQFQRKVAVVSINPIMDVDFFP